MRILMILTSLVSYFINARHHAAALRRQEEIQLRTAPDEPRLDHLRHLDHRDLLARATLLLGDLPDPKYASLWWALAIIISCGTVAGALIPEFTRSSRAPAPATCRRSSTRPPGRRIARHPLRFRGRQLLRLLGRPDHPGAHAHRLSRLHEAVDSGPHARRVAFAAPVFAFGLVAFGFLGMGPVTIAVDSFGPVSDNAQSVYELPGSRAFPSRGRDQEAVRLRSRFRERQRLPRRG